MDIDLPFIRYKDFPVDIPIKLIISDFRICEKYKQFIKFQAFYPYDHGKRVFNVMFPYYKFKNAYRMFPVDKRKAIGDQNIYMEITKLKGGSIRIDKLEKYDPRVHR